MEAESTRDLSLAHTQRSCALSTRFMVGADIFDSLAAQWPETFPNLEETLMNLFSPPQATTLRVACWDSQSKEVNLEEIRNLFSCSCGYKPVAYIHPKLPDAIVMRRDGTADCGICGSCNSHMQVLSLNKQGQSVTDTSTTLHASDVQHENASGSCLNSLCQGPRKVVLVYPKCGEAVLRGAHVYSRGVLASESGIAQGDMVEVFSMPVPAKQSYVTARGNQSECAEAKRLGGFDQSLEINIPSFSDVAEGNVSEGKPNSHLRVKSLGNREENDKINCKFSVDSTTLPTDGRSDAAALLRFSLMLRGTYLKTEDCHVIRKLGVFCGIGRIAIPMGDIYKATGGTAVYMLAGQDLSRLPCWLVAQNLPSIAAARILNPLPGEKVLDMCAAPGHKTSHLASLMHQTGILIAIERSQKRLVAMEAELARRGVNFVECVKGDSTKDNWSCSLGPATSLYNYFDKILVDAPCSGLGLRPRISFVELSRTYLLSCADYQKRFLKRACDFLRVGGVMIFSTCSISPQENELNVQWALDNLPLRLVPQDILLEESQDMRYARPGKWKREIDLNCYRFPPSGDCIGFFVAKFEKIAP